MKKPKKRKLTPLQRLSAARAKHDAAWAAWIAADKEYEATVENVLFGDLETLFRADPSLSLEKRLEILKSANSWPRIVLGIYEAELAIAKKGHGKPSDAAYEKVGKFIGVGEDRVKALCNEGRQQIRERLSEKLKVNISIAEFKKWLHAISNQTTG